MDGGERPPPGGPRDGGGGKQQPGEDAGGGGGARGAAARGESHEVFGDVPLAVSVLVMALLGLLQQLSAPPCTC